jgi:acyl-CoA synthetase (AMP-forming)/AMP-acid ligase II
MPMKNLCEIVDFHARTRPTHPALIGPDASLSYQSFAQRTHQYAAALEDDGVRQGDLVGLAMRDTIDHIVMIFALIRLGAIMVPMDWRWTATEKLALINHFDINLLLVDELDDIQAQALYQCSVGTFKTCMIDNTWLKSAASITRTPPVVVADNLPMVLSLSSGTTSRPSGPLATHAHFLARIQNQITTLTFNQHDRYMLATPLFFGGGRAFVLTHLVIGATVVLNAQPYSSSDLLNAVTHYKVDSLFLVPTLLRRLLQESDAQLSKLKRLRVLISSGSPLHAYERQAIRQRITPGFFEYYASTEGGGISVLNPVDQSRYPDSVGRAAYQVDIQIVNEQHELAAVDEVGQVRYCGPGVAESLYKDPEATAISFLDQWFYPGDLGRMNEEGYLFLLGRSKDIIIRGGVNIYPLEIERVIGSYSSITEVAVLPIAAEEFGEEVVAVIVSSSDISEKELVEYCRERLARYKIPSKFIFTDELPKNSAGKVLKAELAQLLA